MKIFSAVAAVVFLECFTALGKAGTDRDIEVRNDVERHDVADILAVEARQLSSIGVCTDSSTCSSTAIKSTETTSHSTSTTSTHKTSTSKIPTKTQTGYDMTVQTIFTPPPRCTTDGVTQLASDAGLLWKNAIHPIPNATLTGCYPSQFWSSAIATTTLPSFKQIICPLDWETFDVNSTYIICCPK